MSYVQAEDGTMTEQPITVGVSNGNYVEIREGLSEGETVYVVAKTEESDVKGPRAGSPQARRKGRGGSGGSDRPSGFSPNR